MYNGWNMLEPSSRSSPEGLKRFEPMMDVKPLPREVATLASEAAIDNITRKLTTCNGRSPQTVAGSVNPPLTSFFEAPFEQTMVNRYRMTPYGMDFWIFIRCAQPHDMVIPVISPMFQRFIKPLTWKNLV